mmetsp:Transcript_17142/g.36293  ORF Transcript_17142/g.36293 Transcript_17142/m.36293 type:complete len:205 (-) Transcript_17142:292-906(-)
MSEAYSTLGLNRSASTQQIKDAYRDLAKRHHPDLNVAEASEEKFKKITAAYTAALLESSRREKDAAEGKSGHAGGIPRTGTMRTRGTGPIRSAGPLRKDQFDVREWERAHYGLHQEQSKAHHARQAQGEASQSARVRTMHRQHMHAQSARRAAFNPGSPKSFGWLLGYCTSLMVIWQLIYQTQFGRLKEDTTKLSPYYATHTRR